MKILYVDIDTLRPDHLGCYGYARNTSENIDAIARDGVRFNESRKSRNKNRGCLKTRI